MEAERVIEALREKLNSAELKAEIERKRQKWKNVENKELSKGQLEQIYQDGLVNTLERLNHLSVEEKPNLKNKIGRSVPDIFISNTVPPILIEIKAKGD